MFVLQNTAATAKSICEAAFVKGCCRCDQIGKGSELRTYNNTLGIAVDHLGAQAPFALAAVAGRKAHQRVGARLALASIVHHIKRRSRRLIKMD
jgi:hypothetical protein|tara:strand:- start:13014 stop:13295 length:282 start_codon:yes stop_codon:yes gene_type:complete